MSRKRKKATHAAPEERTPFPPAAVLSLKAADALPSRPWASRLDTWATISLYIAAAAWPWGAYQRLFTPVSIDMLAFFPPALYALWVIFSGRRLRVPFELLWPCACLALLALAAQFLSDGNSLALKTLMLCGVFVLVIATARKRDVILRMLWLSLFGCAGVAVLSVMSSLGLLFPTAYNMDTGIVIAGPYSVSGGLLTLVCGLLLCLPLSMIPGGRRWPAIVCGLLIAAALVFLLLPLREQTAEVVAAHAPFLMPTATLTLVLLWLAARVLAKAVVAYRETADRTCLAWAAALTAGFAIALAAGLIPERGQALLAAAGVAWVLPERKESPNPTLPRWMPVPLVLLIAANLYLILPGDPRDYERAAQAALARKDYDGARHHLEFVRQRLPGETRIDYYLARAFLEESRLEEAAASFRRSLRPSSARIRPAINNAEKDYFLMRMRDVSSAVPETLRGLAYERCLLAVGRERHALSLLELRGTAEPPLVVNAQPLARALAALLDAPTLAATFADWEPRLLATILESAGAYYRIAEVPADFPRKQLPLIVSARARAGSIALAAYGPFGDLGGVLLPRPDTTPDVGALLQAAGWDDWRRETDGTWFLPYGTLGEFRLSGVPEFRFRRSVGFNAGQVDVPREMLIFLPGEAELS